jgi:hypothetical protein
MEKKAVHKALKYNIWQKIGLSGTSFTAPYVPLGVIQFYNGYIKCMAFL